MKKYAALVLVLISLFALAAASADSPTASLVALVNHLRALDFEAAVQLLVDPQQGAFLQEAMKDPVQAVVLEKLLKTVEVSYGREEVQGETATVDISLHSVRGEAISNLNAYLAANKALLPEDAEETRMAEALREAISHWDWQGMAPRRYDFRYHLVLVDGAWKLDHTKTEDM
ncbi:MAG: hypothetical protein GX611_06365 [Clostridiales bacterium]|nr:hypothetical protein [Clostridiales bacterium]